jgi:hypothetical protein
MLAQQMRRVTASEPIAIEVVADFFAGQNQYQTTAAGLQHYLDAYVLAVRP